MKPSPKLAPGRQPPQVRPRPSAGSHESAERLEEQIRHNRATTWGTFLIGGFAIGAVFISLELLRPAPQAPSVPETVVTTDAPAKVLEKPSAPEATASVPESTPEQALPAAAPAAIAPAVAKAEPSPATPNAASRLAAENVLLLTGIDSSRDAATRRDEDLLNLAIEGRAWDAYRGLLARSIEPGIASLRKAEGNNRFDPLWKETPLYQALLRWKTLGCFSQSQITARVTDLYSGEFLIWFLNHNDAMEEFLLTIHPEDDGGAVLQFFMDAWALNRDQFEKYFPLAIACAVVFDRPMPIPHPIGNDDYRAESTVNPMQRYLWYVEKTEKGKLAAPVTRSSARDLVWTVCAPVTTYELEWAISKIHKQRKNWGDTYGEIEYLMERAVEGLNPYKEYSFAEILKEGGICGDQSYFCVNTARAQGIPAMILSGETDLGGHAWAALKIDAREWTTGIGRIGGVSKGQAHHPQTGASITEQEIQHWNDRHHQSPTISLNISRHLWLADFYLASEEDDSSADIIRLTNRLGPSFPATWQALYSLLEREMELTGDPPVPGNFDEWKAFASNMRREFKDNPRMAGLAANAEMEYIFPYGEPGDAKRALLRERRRIARDSGEQADLIAGSLKREAGLIHKRGGPDVTRDIGRLYDRALRDYGGSITGFKTMAEDYFSFMRNDPTNARKAARDVELAFKRVVETGTKDWFRANTESSIYRMICSYYRSAGDSPRADLLEKRYQVLLRRSKRSAI
jgi:hypothetical protein